MTRKKQKKEKVSVCFYPDVIQLIDKEAERQHRSRSNMLEVIVKKYFNRNREKIVFQIISPLR